VIKKLGYYLLFGNLFYGICAVSLSIEAAFQLQIPLNHPLFYVALFGGSVVYYTYAYISEKYMDPNNRRSFWYGTHRRTVWYSRVIFTLLAAASAIWLLIRFYRGFALIPWTQWLVALAFPLVAAFYYDIPLLRSFGVNMRKTGWLKPFVIGFVWAGAITIYPLLWQEIESERLYPFAVMTGWLALKNWMYITVLCIMFDIKDYASDSNHHLKTFVVQFGLRRTIFNILIPITLAGVASLVIFAWYMNFHPMKVILNLLPFIGLIVVAWSLHQRRNILYYLGVIDGMMLVKAIFGTLAAILVK
jgi:hypothetical protein